MSRPARAALVAIMAVATFALAPSAVAENATLKVTAHVVNRCTVAVPHWIAASEWRRWQHRPGHFVRHDCHGRAPFWVQVAKAWLRQVRELGDVARPPAGRQQRTRHPSRDDLILVTITY